MSVERLYGVHSVERVLKQAPHLVYSLILPQGHRNPRQQALLQQAEHLGVAVRFEGKSFFAKLEAVHQGVIAEVAEKAQFSEQDLLALVENKPNALILFLDEIQDPHNLGAMLRTADATGVDAVVIPKNNAVGVNPTVRKVACGAAETMNVAVVTNLSRTLVRLKDAGLWVVGLAGETEQMLYQTRFSGALGIVMGAEGTGLRQLTRQHCDEIVAIPMCGTVESLNVSVATGVVLYEVWRQRHLVV
ncbi:MAG: 23S rRNA (guanosine(2251)-2'-O)-methyltransferase RlmB [Thiomicrospira sp.]